MNFEPSLKDVYHVIENPLILNELDAVDLLSLRARVQDIVDPELDALWEVLLARTSSLG